MEIKLKLYVDSVEKLKKYLTLMIYLLFYKFLISKLILQNFQDCLAIHNI